MTLTVADLLTLDRTKMSFSTESIVGTTASGELNRSDHPQLIRSSQKMGIPHYRNSLVWAIHALYILITVRTARTIGSNTISRGCLALQICRPWIVATVDHIGRHPHLHLWSLALELGTAVFSEQTPLAQDTERW